MGVFEFVQKLPERGVRTSIGELRVGIRRRSNWLARRGTNIFDQEWDVCLVLDACRADLLDSVADEYEFITGDQSIHSVGGTSPEWIEETFGKRSPATLESMGYVTGNPYSSQVDINTSRFGVLDEVWRYGWDADIGVVPPRMMTDRAIAVGREHDLDRLIVHYMQPHIPFLDDPELSRKMSDGTTDEFRIDTETVWDRLRAGEVEVDTVWEAYRQNLRHVLDSIRLLRKNVDANWMAITADHGNAMGELGQYGHGRTERVDSVCRVPWEVTDARDTGNYEPTVQPEPQRGDSNVNDQLRALGYK